MFLYDIPHSRFSPKVIKSKRINFLKQIIKRKEIELLVFIVFLSSLLGAFIGAGVVWYAFVTPGQPFGIENIAPSTAVEKEYVPQTTEEQKIIELVEQVSPSVVSIIITKDIPIIEQFFTDPLEDFFGGSGFQIPQYRQRGVEKREIGGGSGFIVSSDGLVVTNKHVVLDEDAEYTVLTNDGKRYAAQVLARDPVQDLAVLKIQQEQTVDSSGIVTQKAFVAVRLGDSDALRIGQTVVAIGNALGEFRNTVSVGVISGLGRTITASDGNNFVETIEDVIQTDAAINKGNSGGPILNLAGEVVGINTATVLDAQSIGFAIPVNKVKRDIEQVKASGKIVYPFLGVRYIIITRQVQQERNLAVDYGALISQSVSGESGITPDSAAQRAGILEGDIILEFNGERITKDNSLAKLIQKRNPGDIVVLKILREGEEKILSATLGERS